MANDTTSTLIGGRFAVDPSHPLTDFGGGIPAFAAADRLAPSARRVAI